MALEMAELGQPVLRKKAAEVPIERIATPQFQEFLEAMHTTLLEKAGAGLAAPQVFVSQRVFLGAIELPEEEDAPPGVEAFINPTITPLSEEMVLAWEGCLSFPELLVLVPRHRTIRIDYLDADGEPSSLELTDFPARVIQHENDHLDGVLTIDRAPSTLHIVKASEIDAVRAELGDVY